MNLFERSIEIILENQASTGAYLASPNFATYRYSWFRDGSFIAYAMDLVGEHASAERFHDWAASVVNDRKDTVRRAISKTRDGKRLTGTDYLHTRYTIDGREAAAGWPNHQLDGFGTWLWSLERHHGLTGFEPAPDRLEAAGMIAEYLAGLWESPCYDCWEEFPDQVHTYTLAAIRGGLTAQELLTGIGHADVVAAIDDFITNRGRWNGHYVKYRGAEVVDASLLGLAVPYGVIEPASPGMRATVELIEATLRRGGGVHRYPTDTYYGGGEWVLLTCWLAWYHLALGDGAAAGSSLDWVEAQADEDGFLPEQVPTNLIAPERYWPWHERWGEIASPLLWSHAMYLICEVTRR